MTLRLAVALPLLAVLTGCTGSASDTFGSSVWITPAKYQFHDCLQAQKADANFAARQKQLEELMTRSAAGPGGEFVNTMVYRSEYQQVLGERDAIKAQYAAKRCTIESTRTSDRQVF